MRAFAFLPRWRWEDWLHSLVCTLNMELQAAASWLILAQWREHVFTLTCCAFMGGYDYFLVEHSEFLESCCHCKVSDWNEGIWHIWAWKLVSFRRSNTVTFTVFVSYPLNRKYEQPSGGKKNVHLRLLSRRHQEFLTSMIWGKELQTCQQSVGRMAANAPSLAAASK